MFSSVSLYVSDKNLIPAMLHELETIKSPKPLKYGQLRSSRSLKKQQNTHLKNWPAYQLSTGYWKGLWRSVMLAKHRLYHDGDIFYFGLKYL